MLTLQQSHEVRAAIIEYLRATFTFKERAVGNAFLDFITDEEQGLFRGPFLSAKLPFVRAAEDVEIPLTIKPPFAPFDHQLKAFQRLNIKDSHIPKPTILTTGTGSGKTESFLFPLLDYCYQKQEQTGIKAIILYPMNALATDQAGRLAEAIHNNPLLKGNIRAGLFIGAGGQKVDLPKVMGKNHLIEDQNTILDAPPDILLTNFKMLDYALMRSKYHRIWRLNLGNPTLLKFLVLDELHTYDGAQGTDVANLIRRLKLKLDLPKGQLCPIGTSATIGTGADAPNLLAEYATRVFGEKISTSAIIKELRVTPSDFFAKPVNQLETNLPNPTDIKNLARHINQDYKTYLKQQKNLWGFDESVTNVELGKLLKDKKIVYDILEVCEKGYVTESQLEQRLNQQNPDFRQIPERVDSSNFNPKVGIIQSLFALMGAAKTANEGGNEFPFLYLQVQMWIRELSGIQRSISEEFKFQWRDQTAAHLGKVALPPWFCRECGASGWLMVKYDNRNHFEQDILEVYDKYFSNHKNIYFANLNTEQHQAIEGYEATDTFHKFVHPVSLEIYDRALGNRIPMVSYRQTNNNFSRHICPECNSRTGLSIIGTRIATLASITTSQVISSDLDFQSEKDRKLLAFTNGVQDAAHQAGFIQARNYRFTFRSALQQVIGNQNAPIRLTDLQDEFLKFWKANADVSGKGDLAAYIYKFFPSDKEGKVNLESYRFKNGKFKDAFLREFDVRVAWDIVSEFGYNAMIGRTLAKTSTSSAFVDFSKIQAVFDQLKSWLEENNLGMIKRKELESFLTGLLYRIRIRGGVEHPYLLKFRINDLKPWELNWNKDKRHFLNRGFGTSSRLPKMLTPYFYLYKENIDSTFTENTNWFHAYFRKSFLLASSDNAIVNDFYKKILPLLAEESIGILDKKEGKKVENYALRAEAILVENGVKKLECNQCQHQVFSTPTAAKKFEEVSCLNYQCSGNYQILTEGAADTYYKKVYNRARIPRIYSTDHTGLLPRKERELKENDFKNRPRFNSLNTLVATSTLEMGIDIGDLNTALNTSVPPLPSNFLQRVGRAGRKSGAALLLNFAGNDKHDQFYFEAPLEMMAGQVHPPGCFLEAKEILKRHFLAFCIDSWTTADPDKNRIPAMLIHLQPASINLEDSTFFVNRLIGFVQKNESELLKRFQSKYGEEIDTSVFRNLEENLRTQLFYQNLKLAFKQLIEEYRALRQKRFDIIQDIKKRKLKKNDDERIELEQEMRNLRGTQKILEKRQLLEQMTNVGLLPNYAFPETGVKLNATIAKSKVEGQNKTPVPKDIELVRPARQAMKELIPDNYFYTQGYKLQISGLNITSWEEESNLMRYCSNCDFIAQSENKSLFCPKCSDPSFGSNDNTHRFLQLNAVKSYSKEQDAKLDDANEERLSEIALRTFHFRFDKSVRRGAYAIKSVPFGIEYVTELDIYEVNAGLSKDIVNRSRLTTINEREVPVSGYITCRYCGKSSSQTHKKEKNRPQQKEPRDYHYPYCKHKTLGYQSQSDKVFEEVFLFRKMTTEALKILLPVQEFEAQSSIAMFMSGLDLGLRKFYKGNPQHIGLREYREFNFQTGKFDNYIVLFDLVPGGTGYLSKLFNPQILEEVLKLAYIHIRDCKCQHHEKDGCYHCIFSYGNRYFQEELSRRKAEDLFYRIIMSGKKWEYLPNGIGNITNDGQIEESELEERFIRALRNYTLKKEQAEAGCSFEEENQDGVICYRLILKNESSRFEYFIQPQYNLGRAQNVNLSTIADFLIRCLSVTIAGRDLEENELSKFVPLAVYLDGYQYHATKNNPRFEKDVAKRAAILHSNQYLTWTLTYDDVKFFENQLVEDANCIDKYEIQSRENAGIRTKLLNLPMGKKADKSFFSQTNNLARLIWWLRSPRNENTQAAIKTYLISLQEKFPGYTLSEKDVLEAIKINQSFHKFNTSVRDKSAYCYASSIPSVNNEFNIQLALRVKDFNPLAGLFVQYKNDDFDKISWNIFWQTFNLLQLIIEDLESFKFMADDQYFAVKTVSQESTTTQSEDEIFEYFDEEYHPIIQKLLVYQIPFDKDGSFVLTDEDDRVIAEGILGFPSLKIVFEPFEDYEKIFRELGYRILLPNEFNEPILSQLKSITTKPKN